MKIALAQMASRAGDLEANLARHLAALEVLQPGDADLAVFPELSLSGYQPELAGATAIDANDRRLAPLDAFATRHGIAVCAGVPIATGDRPEIAALLFTPDAPRRVIRKAYLHVDEEAFFAPGSGQAVVLDMGQRIGIAICHDLNVDAHIEQAAGRRMAAYVASVAKTADGIASARRRLAGLASDYAIPALVVNCTGSCEGKAAGGGSLAIDRSGKVFAELDREQQAWLICDIARMIAERRPIAG